MAQGARPLRQAVTAASAPPLDGRVAVFDLEWTSWEGAQARNWSGPGEEQEIVEIGAVLLDGRAGLRELAAFELLVRPVVNPRLSAYFTGLTGITQAMVDRGGVPFAEAIASFATFLGVGLAPAGTAVSAALSFGRDPGVLRRNCRLNGIACPIPETLFHNVRPLVAAFAGVADGEPFSACDLPVRLGFPAPADSHRALADARCIAEALRRWRAS